MACVPGFGQQGLVCAGCLQEAPTGAHLVQRAGEDVQRLLLLHQLPGDAVEEAARLLVVRRAVLAQVLRACKSQLEQSEQLCLARDVHKTIYILQVMPASTGAAHNCAVQVSPQLQGSASSACKTLQRCQGWMQSNVHKPDEA